MSFNTPRRRRTPEERANIRRIWLAGILGLAAGALLFLLLLLLVRVVF